MGNNERIKARRKRKSDLALHTSGRLIEENHNGYDYTPEYTKKAVAWRFFELWMKTQKYQSTPEKLWEYFGRLREGLQTLLLHWPNSTIPRGEEFWLIYRLLGYWREGNQRDLTKELYQYFR